MDDGDNLGQVGAQPLLADQVDEARNLLKARVQIIRRRRRPSYIEHNSITEAFIRTLGGSRRGVNTTIIFDYGKLLRGHSGTGKSTCELHRHNDER